MRGTVIAVLAFVAFLGVALWWATSGGDDAPRPAPPAAATPDAAVAPIDAAVTVELRGADAGNDRNAHRFTDCAPDGDVASVTGA